MKKTLFKLKSDFRLAGDHWRFFISPKIARRSVFTIKPCFVIESQKPL